MKLIKNEIDEVAAYSVSSLRIESVLNMIYKELSYASFKSAVSILKNAKEAAEDGKLEFVVSLSGGKDLKPYIERLGFVMSQGDFNSHWVISF
ncbi:hypothetical protein [Kosakonia phage 305]|uniref:Uncharacterized protein n=1 Tax=Kosakonia phage 305 TaxID=2863193 RepID=A0AAE7WG86_9CAUD|nr:hypothetical protein PP421_gp111 [Kosakonia phage 305]QYN80262.1 hypothetical protein [Kosakonia phage 305]